MCRLPASRTKRQWSLSLTFWLEYFLHFHATLTFIFAKFFLVLLFKLQFYEFRVGFFAFPFDFINRLGLLLEFVDHSG